MIRYQKCFYFLVPALLIVCLSGRCFGQITRKLETQPAESFNTPTEELIKENGTVVRGHQIGGGFFQPCKGDPIKMDNYKTRPSEECSRGRSSGTHNFPRKKVSVISFDQEKRTIKVKTESGSEEEIFIPPTIQWLNNGKDPTTFSLHGL